MNCAASPDCWKRLPEANQDFQRFDHPEPSVMRQFYELEAAGWKGNEGLAINCDPARRAFYDAIAQEASQRDYFSLHTLDVEGKMAAGAFSVTTDDCFYPMKIAHNEEWRRGAPGLFPFQRHSGRMRAKKYS